MNWILGLELALSLNLQEGWERPQLKPLRDQEEEIKEYNQIQELSLTLL